MKRITVEEINSRKPERSLLTATKEVSPKRRKNGFPIRQFLYVCKCGEERVSTATEIMSGATLSCGCIKHDLVPANKKYNIPFAKLKSVYYQMIDRCYKPSNVGYRYYGARGVVVCDEWRSNPQSFFDWAAIGYKEGLQLDKDIIGTGFLYSPDTCCWITHKKNQSKTQRSHKVIYNGEEINLCTLSEISGIPDETLRHRITHLGLSPEEAVTWKKHKHTKKRKSTTNI